MSMYEEFIAAADARGIDGTALWADARASGWDEDLFRGYILGLLNTWVRPVYRSATERHWAEASAEMSRLAGRDQTG